MSEKSNRFAKSESMLAKAVEEKQAAPVETLAEKYAREVEKNKMVRVSLSVPNDVKIDLDALAQSGEIKSINHYINYLIKEDLATRKAMRKE